MMLPAARTVSENVIREKKKLKNYLWNFVLERETSKRIHNLTYIIGVMTILYTIMTLLMLFKSNKALRNIGIKE